MCRTLVEPDRVRVQCIRDYVSFAPFDHYDGSFAQSNRQLYPEFPLLTTWHFVNFSKVPESLFCGLDPILDIIELYVHG